jgi:hypothetical protein
MNAEPDPDKHPEMTAANPPTKITGKTQMNTSGGGGYKRSAMVTDAKKTSKNTKPNPTPAENAITDCLFITHCSLIERLTYSSRAFSDVQTLKRLSWRRGVLTLIRSI